MANNKKFEAHLIKYRQTDMRDPVWFWINPSSGSTLSPKFATQGEAENWYDRIITTHEESYNLLTRLKNGKFYRVFGRVDLGDVISSKKANECPFTLYLEDDILEVEVLAIDIEDARNRVSEYFEILEWIDQ
jgi:hypothetical protein